MHSSEMCYRWAPVRLGSQQHCPRGTVRPCTHQSHDCLFRCHCSLAMLAHSNGPRTSLATPIWQGFTQGSRSRLVTGLQQQRLWKCTTTAARTLGQPFQDAPPRANRWLSRWIRRCLLVQLHTFVVEGLEGLKRILDC